MANTGKVIYQDLEEYYVNGPNAGQPTGQVKPNDVNDNDYIAPVDYNPFIHTGIDCSVPDQGNANSFSVEGPISSHSNACVLAREGNFGTTVWSSCSNLGTGCFLYNSETGAINEDPGDYVSNGFYADTINGQNATYQVSGGEIVSITFC